MPKISKAQRREEIESATRMLQELFPRGSSVCTIVRKVSASGMSRQISVLGMFMQSPEDAWQLTGRGDVVSFSFRHPNWAVATVLGWQLTTAKSDYDAIVVKGCGMDMQYHLVSSLSHALYGQDDLLNVVKL
jgi:hypothetical protein